MPIVSTLSQMNLTPLGPSSAPSASANPVAYHVPSGVTLLCDADSADDGQIYIRFTDSTSYGKLGVFAIDPDGTIVDTSAYLTQFGNFRTYTNLAVNKSNGDVAWGGGFPAYIYTENDMSTGFVYKQGNTSAAWGGSIPNRFAWIGNDLYSMKHLYSTTAGSAVTKPCILKHTVSTGAISNCIFPVASSSDDSAAAYATQSFCTDSSFTYAASKSTTYRWVCKRSTTGALVWSRRGVNNTTWGDKGFCVIDDSSNVYVSWRSGSPTFGLTKFNSSGIEQYTVGSSGTWPTYLNPQYDMAAAVADGYLVIAFRKNSGNGVAVVGVNASSGAVEYYYQITDSSTGANSSYPVSMGKSPDETHVYVCTGRTMFSLPANGAVTAGTYGSYVVSAETTPTLVSETSPWTTNTLTGIIDTTNSTGTRTASTTTISTVGVTPLS